MMPESLLFMAVDCRLNLPYFYAMKSLKPPFFTVLLLAAMMTACDQFDKPARHGKSDSVMGYAALRPQVFITAPDSLEGCQGLYTYDSLKIPFDSLDVDKGKKIFVTKPTEFGILMLGNKKVALKYDRDESKELGAKSFKEVYKGNDGLMVILTDQAIKKDGEVVWVTGTLEIRRGKSWIRVRIRGVVGC